MDYEWALGAHERLELAAVATWEVIEVLYSSRRWPRPAHTREGLAVLTVWGRTDEGRPLIVLLRQIQSEPGLWQILMAAEMRPHQLNEFTSWEAQQ